MPSFRNHRAVGLKRPKQKNSLLPKCQVCVRISKETLIGYTQFKPCYELNKANPVVGIGSALYFELPSTLHSQPFIRQMLVYISDTQELHSSLIKP